MPDLSPCCRQALDQVSMVLFLVLFTGTSVDKVCQHAGRCEDTGKTHLCHCQEGYIGSYCEKEVDECLSNPCRNGATCSDYQGAYTCGVRTCKASDSDLMIGCRDVL